ncbi:MAG: hypothetical protein IKK67_03420 [Bacteroidaceae bacterium]|nr:hypothetical protein [Bacteroidaceae bacterium]
MKKKILSAMFAVAIMAVAGFNVYMNQTKSNFSELALANIEALANDESSTGTLDDCNKLCVTDYNCHCHITYPGTDIEGIMCYYMRAKSE